MTSGVVSGSSSGLSEELLGRVELPEIDVHIGECLADVRHVAIPDAGDVLSRRDSSPVAVCRIGIGVALTGAVTGEARVLPRPVITLTPKRVQRQQLGVVGDAHAGALLDDVGGAGMEHRAA